MTERYLAPRKRILGTCTYCRGPVKKPRRYWCSDDCVHEWKVRTSGSYIRSCLLKRDRGVCQQCGRDCRTVQRQLRCIRNDLLKAHWGGAAVEANRLAAQFWALAATFNYPKPKGNLLLAIVKQRPRTLWEAEHIIPVIEGGGCCGLDNLTTLCRTCHLKSTAALAKRKTEKSKRKRAKKK